MALKNFTTTEITEHTEKEETNALTSKIIGAAIEVHRALGPVHEAQILSYLKLSGCKIGLLINFNVKILKEGLRRIRL